MIQLELVYDQRLDEIALRDPPLYDVLKYADSNFADDPKD